MRIMGLDLGTRTIGVAVSDETGFIARGVETIRRKGLEKVLIQADLQRKKRKKIIDMMAAVVILQNYLDSPRRN